MVSTTKNNKGRMVVYVPVVDSPGIYVQWEIGISDIELQASRQGLDAAYHLRDADTEEIEVSNAGELKK